MNGSWYTISEIITGENGRIDLVACTGESSPWFEGHFPGEPILPGIAQIYMVWDAIRKAKKPDRIPVIKEVKRLRFRQIIRPNDQIQVGVEPDRNKKGHYAFKISVRGELACNGSIITGEAEGPASE